MGSNPTPVSFPPLVPLQSSAKELSYSEMDLRKPKRFATFSLALGKKKKKPNESFSKSTFGLGSNDAASEVLIL